MIVQCPHCGKPVVVNGLGRKGLNIPFKNVYEALQLYRDVGQAAQELNCSVGYIYGICKEHGMRPKDLIGAKTREA